mmetsp:Transcript_28014/g.50728  ORF Transcript_28014/g.50728 Transcript_28014/m.50728 type:complete len:88 (-) Transcript_28014:45-308(-)
MPDIGGRFKWSSNHLLPNVTSLDLSFNFTFSQPHAKTLGTTTEKSHYPPPPSFVFASMHASKPGRNQPEPYTQCAVKLCVYKIHHVY